MDGVGEQSIGGFGAGKCLGTRAMLECGAQLVLRSIMANSTHHSRSLRCLGRIDVKCSQSALA